MFKLLEPDCPPSPACSSCGQQTRLLATLRQMNQYPVIAVYKCDDCRTIATISAHETHHH